MTSASLRRPDLTRRLSRYLTIGGLAFVLDATMFALVHVGLGMPTLLANVGSTAVATGFSFVMNARLTFGVNDRLLERALQFASVSCCGLAISSLLLWFFAGALNAPAVWVKVGIAPVVFAAQFTLNSLVTFAPGGVRGR